MNKALFYQTDAWMIFFCECKHPVHQICVAGDEYDVTIGVHLEYPCGFWERLKRMFQYLCNQPSRFGHFDTVMLNKDTAYVMGQHLIELAQNITKE